MDWLAVLPLIPVEAPDQEPAVWDPQPRRRGGVVGVGAAVAMGTFGALVVLVLAAAVLWLRWNPVREDRWVLRSSSADGKELLIEADGCIGGIPQVRVDEQPAFVGIYVSERGHRYIPGTSCGQIGRELTVSLREALNGRPLRHA